MTTGSFLCLVLLPIMVTSFDELHFLKEYGYLPSSSNAQFGSDVVGNALRTLQKAYGLEQTGQLDAQTAAAMREPRCGAKDVVETKRKKRWQEPKWDKRHLTYGVSEWSKHLSAGRVEQLLMKATAAWTEAADFTFSRAHHPDIPIRFGVGKHNCTYRFEPAVLAHTFPPMDGSMHFNDMHVWKDTEVSDARGISLYSVAVHELGHALGLKHNMDEPNSIMSPRELFRKGEITERDKYMLKRLYGTLRKEDKAPPLPVDPTTTPRSLSPTRPPSLGPPDICKCSVDAIGTFRGEFIVFKDDWLWRMPHEGKRILRPEKISSLLPQVPSPVDAAVEIDSDLWVFSGQKAYVINVGVGGFQLKHSPLTFSQLGLPDELERIRLTYKWHYFDPPAVYLWGEKEYWRMNVAERRMEATYPRPIERNWKYVPSEAVAAFNKERELHFLTDTRVYRMNTTDYRLSVAAGYPIDIDRFWHGCAPTEAKPPPTRYSRSSSDGSHKDVLWVTIPLLLLIFC